MSKLGNPVVIEAVKSQAGQKAVEKATEIIPFALKTLFILGILAFAWYKFTNRFKPIQENPDYPNANVSHGNAKTKAEGIYNAMVGFGANIDAVASNIAGLNYNGFVRVFNAFGERQGVVPFSDKMNMVEWFYDQFDDAEITKLRFLVPNVFKQAQQPTTPPPIPQSIIDFWFNVEPSMLRNILQMKNYAIIG